MGKNNYIESLQKKVERVTELMNAGWQKHKACKQVGITVGYYTSEMAKKRAIELKEELIRNNDPIVLDAEIIEPQLDDSVEVDLGEPIRMVAPMVITPNTNIDIDRLGKAVYNYRIKNKISQQTFADMVGIPNGSSISQIELKRAKKHQIDKFVNTVIKKIDIGELLEYADLDIAEGICIKGTPKDYKSECAELKKENEELKARLSVLENEANSNRSNISTTMQRNNKLAVELEQATEKICKLQNELAKKPSEIFIPNEDIEKLKATITKLKDERDRYKKIVDKLIA